MNIPEMTVASSPIADLPASDLPASDLQDVSSARLATSYIGSDGAPGDARAREILSRGAPSNTI
jgi:hypothetical protein